MMLMQKAQGQTVSRGSAPVTLSLRLLSCDVHVMTVAFRACIQRIGKQSRQSLSALGDEMLYFYLLKTPRFFFNVARFSLHTHT